MGGGGLIQLIAYGAQDIYLTGQPQITFFKAVYRRYTNFAIESIQQDILGSPQFGNLVNLTISRNGDLLKRLWIEYSPIDILEGINEGNGLKNKTCKGNEKIVAIIAIKIKMLLKIEVFIIF